MSRPGLATEVLQWRQAGGHVQQTLYCTCQVPIWAVLALCGIPLPAVMACVIMLVPIIE